MNDSQIDFQNDAADYVVKKGDVIWIEYDDHSTVDGHAYIMYKTRDKDNYDTINSMFIKCTSTTVPDSLTDLAATISVVGVERYLDVLVRPNSVGSTLPYCEK